ncbi:tyrosine-protein kinase HTK16-like [Oppia nitens]|uniref:tyrosine-protein kinase HTK16-like n=1 Tax=Oppia nitens TaxID=1686743 RepID=UPI0023DA3103|nr:tyrosine-protein kinase HTK16-like [Oppia nitens]
MDDQYIEKAIKTYDIQNNSNDWYFSSISRYQAEDILKNNGLSDGLFLVRQSVSSVGDYVLSCVHKGSVVHYQIQRIGTDPFFTINKQDIYHGLDVLLKHLKKINDSNDSFFVPKDYCRGINPPENDILKPDRTNLLHRTVASGLQTLVNDILCAENIPNLEVRDELGRTALLIAMNLDEIKGYQIVRQLIKAGVDVNSRDFESITALQLCAKLNKPVFAKLLINEGKARTYDRTIGQKWVAMHFAAYYGNIDVLKLLLESGAAPQPRDANNNRPADIAFQLKHIKCQKLCDFYANRPVFAFKHKNQWLYEHLRSRYSTNKLFEISSMREGSYLVRRSDTKKGNYVLTVSCTQKIYNFEIQHNFNHYYIDSGPYWPSLEHLIDYHMRNSDGLPSRLSAPVSSFIDISTNEMLIHGITTNKTADSVYNERNDHNKELKSILFINKNDVKTGSLIGNGEYGLVFKGVWSRASKNEISVAVKLLSQQGLHTRHLNNIFIKEVETMACLRHEYIIRLLGVCIGPPLMMIQELAPMGSLVDYLTDKPNGVDITRQLKLWSIQIAIGMRYLKSQHFVHRDLAARNVLIVSLKQIKISDFGLSRALTRDQAIYKASNGDRWPIRWYAPESLKYGIFTHASDVWSYGVLLWEMYSYGDEPYTDVENREIIRFIERGKRLSKPDLCSDLVFALMSLCWSLDPLNRPSFDEIVQILYTNDCTYESMKDDIKETIDM